MDADFANPNLNRDINESMLRMQKLAGLITESDIKKKLSLNENIFDRKRIITKKLPNVPGVNPEVVNFFYKLQPEEVPGSWDDINHRFTVPHSYENLDYTEEDFQDTTHWLNAQDKGVELRDLPTEYIEIDTYPVGDENFPVTARNFAKYVRIGS